MKKLLCCFLILVVFFVLSACQNKVEAEYHVSSFDGEKLYIECDGNTLVYERDKPGVGSLTKKTMLDMALMIAGVPNVTDQGFTNADNASALEKKFFPLDQVLQQADKLFKKEFLRLWEMITHRINLKKGGLFYEKQSFVNNSTCCISYACMG